MSSFFWIRSCFWIDWLRNLNLLCSHFLFFLFLFHHLINLVHADRFSETIFFQLLQLSHQVLDVTLCVSCLQVVYQFFELVVIFIVFEKFVSLFLSDVYCFAIFQGDVKIVSHSWWHINFETIYFPFNAAIFFANLSSEKLSWSWKTIFFVPTSQKWIAWVLDQFFKIA